MLAEAPGGLPFPEVVAVLRERQQHDVHRGTVRALLRAGGFVQRDRRWFAAPDAEASTRQVRLAVVESLTSPEEAENLARPHGDAKRLRVLAQAIQSRLRALIASLQNVKKP